MNHYKIIFDIEAEQALDLEELRDIAAVMGKLTNDTLDGGTVVKIAAGEISEPPVLVKR